MNESAEFVRYWGSAFAIAYWESQVRDANKCIASANSAISWVKRHEHYMEDDEQATIDGGLLMYIGFHDRQKAEAEMNLSLCRAEAWVDKDRLDEEWARIGACREDYTKEKCRDKPIA